MRRRLCVLGATLLLCATGASAQTAAPTSPPAPAALPPVTLSLDTTLSQETGADLLFTAASLFAPTQSKALAWTRSNRVLGLGARLAWTVFVDHPVAVFLLVTQHEAFGHGGRAREFGSEASFTMGSPWTADALFHFGTRFGGGATFSGAGLSTAQIMAVRAGGVEANTTSATRIERDLVAGQRLAPAQLLYFIRSRLYVTQYAVRTADPVTDPRGFYEESQGGDFANYLGNMSTILTGQSGITSTSTSALVRDEYAGIRQKSTMPVFDPGVWLSAWSLATQIATGDDADAVPVPVIAGHRVLPVVSADWFSDGGVVSVETVVAGVPRDAPRWTSLVVRSGNGPSGQMFSVGAATNRVGQWGRVRVGGEVEGWRQPTAGQGAGLVIRAGMVDGPLTGVRLDVGVKTRGDWPGHPAPGGAFLRIAFSNFTLK